MPCVYTVSINGLKLEVVGGDHESELDEEFKKKCLRRKGVNTHAPKFKISNYSFKILSHRKVASLGV